MQTQPGPIDLLVEKAEQYGKTSIELYRLKAIAQSADILSSLVAKLAMYVFFTLFFLILNIGVALWIGTMLHAAYLGFFIVAGFYLLGGILLYIFRGKWIKDPIHSAIVTQALN